MAIVQVPTIQPASSSRPIVWRSSYNVADPDTCKLAEITVNLDGTAIGTLILKPVSSAAAGGGTTDYFFNIDVSGLVDINLGANTSAPLPSVFGVLGSEGIGINTEFYGSISIDIVYRVLDAATGLLGAAEGAESSAANVLAYKAARQHLDSMNLDEFTQLPDARPLTDLPTALTMREDQNLFFAYIHPYEYIKIQTYDLAGVLSGTYFAVLSGTANRQQTAGIGAANIGQYALYYGGASFPAINTISRYTVDFGTGVDIPPLLYTQISETYTITIDRSACTSRIFRLHWLNTLGAADAYNFVGVQETELNSKSERGQKSLDWPHLTEDYGQYKHNVTAFETIKLETEPLRPSLMQALKGILYSPLVALEQDSKYISVIIEDSTQVVDQTTGLLRLQLTIRYANDIIIANI